MRYEPPLIGVLMTISGGVVSIAAKSSAVPPFEARMSMTWKPSPVIELGAGPNGAPSTLTWKVTPAGAVMFSVAALVNQLFVFGPVRVAAMPPVGGGGSGAPTK